MNKLHRESVKNLCREIIKDLDSGDIDETTLQQAKAIVRHLASNQRGNAVGVEVYDLDDRLPL